MLFFSSIPLNKNLMYKESKHFIKFHNYIEDLFDLKDNFEFYGFIYSHFTFLSSDSLAIYLYGYNKLKPRWKFKKWRKFNKHGPKFNGRYSKFNLFRNDYPRYDKLRYKPVMATRLRKKSKYMRFTIDSHKKDIYNSTNVYKTKISRDIYFDRTGKTINFDRKYIPIWLVNAVSKGKRTKKIRYFTDVFKFNKNLSFFNTYNNKFSLFKYGANRFVVKYLLYRLELNNKRKRIVRVPNVRSITNFNNYNRFLITNQNNLNYLYNLSYNRSCFSLLRSFPKSTNYRSFKKIYRVLPFFRFFKPKASLTIDYIKPYTKHYLSREVSKTSLPDVRTNRLPLFRRNYKFSRVKNSYFRVNNLNKFVKTINRVGYVNLKESSADSSNNPVVFAKKVLNLYTLKSLKLRPISYKRKLYFINKSKSVYNNSFYFIDNQRYVCKYLYFNSFNTNNISSSYIFGLLYAKGTIIRFNSIKFSLFRRLEEKKIKKTVFAPYNVFRYKRLVPISSRKGFTFISKYDFIKPSLLLNFYSYIVEIGKTRFFRDISLHNHLLRLYSTFFRNRGMNSRNFIDSFGNSITNNYRSKSFRKKNNRNIIKGKRRKFRALTKVLALSPKKKWDWYYRSYYVYNTYDHFDYYTSFKLAMARLIPRVINTKKYNRRDFGFFYHTHYLNYKFAFKNRLSPYRLEDISDTLHTICTSFAYRTKSLPNKKILPFLNRDIKPMNNVVSYSLTTGYFLKKYILFSSKLRLRLLSGAFLRNNLQGALNYSYNYNLYSMRLRRFNNFVDNLWIYSYTFSKHSIYRRYLSRGFVRYFRKGFVQRVGTGIKFSLQFLRKNYFGFAPLYNNKTLLSEAKILTSFYHKFYKKSKSIASFYLYRWLSNSFSKFLSKYRIDYTPLNYFSTFNKDIVKKRHYSFLKRSSIRTRLLGLKLFVGVINRLMTFQYKDKKFRTYYLTKGLDPRYSDSKLRKSLFNFYKYTIKSRFLYKNNKVNSLKNNFVSYIMGNYIFNNKISSSNSFNSLVHTNNRVSRIKMSINSVKVSGKKESIKLNSFRRLLPKKVRKNYKKLRKSNYTYKIKSVKVLPTYVTSAVNNLKPKNNVSTILSLEPISYFQRLLLNRFKFLTTTVKRKSKINYIHSYFREYGLFFYKRNKNIFKPRLFKYDEDLMENDYYLSLLKSNLSKKYQLNTKLDERKNVLKYIYSLELLDSAETDTTQDLNDTTYKKVDYKKKKALDKLIREENREFSNKNAKYLATYFSKKLRYSFYLTYVISRYSKYFFKSNLVFKTFFSYFKINVNFIKDYIKAWWRLLKIKFYNSRYSLSFMGHLNSKSILIKNVPNLLTSSYSLTTGYNNIQYYKNSIIFVNSLKKNSEVSPLFLSVYKQVSGIKWLSDSSPLASSNYISTLLPYFYSIRNKTLSSTLSRNKSFKTSRTLFYLLNLYYIVIKKAFFNVFNKKLVISFRLLKKNSITSFVVVRYLIYQVMMRKTLFQALTALKFHFFEKFKVLKNKFMGYRLLCKGKFTRMPRSKCYRFDYGYLGLSRSSMYLDRFSSEISLKYGRCSLDLTLNRRKSLYYKNFQYNLF